MLMTWLMKPLARWIGGALAVLLFLGAIYASGRHSMAPKVKGLQAEVANLTRDRNKWHDGAILVAKAKLAQANRAKSATTSDRTQCSTDIEHAQTSQRAVNKVNAKPVKLDAHQCPIRSKVTNDELTAILMAGAHR